MAVFKIQGENRSVFEGEKFSRELYFTNEKEEAIYKNTGKHAEMKHRFRVCDGDGITYFWGVCSSDSSFAPLDMVGADYGCTYIEYKNPKTGEYEEL